MQAKGCRPLRLEARPQPYLSWSLWALSWSLWAVTIRRRPSHSRVLSPIELQKVWTAALFDRDLSLPNHTGPHLVRATDFPLDDLWAITALSWSPRPRGDVSDKATPNHR